MELAPLVERPRDSLDQQSSGGHGSDEDDGLRVDDLERANKRVQPEGKSALVSRRPEYRLATHVELLRNCDGGESDSTEDGSRLCGPGDLGNGLEESRGLLFGSLGVERRSRRV